MEEAQANKRTGINEYVLQGSILLNCCTVLHDEGMSYGDYVEKLTYMLKDDALEDSANLPNPDVIAQEIVDDLEAALEQFRLIANDLGDKGIL